MTNKNTKGQGLLGQGVSCYQSEGKEKKEKKKKKKEEENVRLCRFTVRVEPPLRRGCFVPAIRGHVTPPTNGCSCHIVGSGREGTDCI